MPILEDALDAMNGHVRVGFVLDSDFMAPWQAAIVDEVVDGAAYELVQVFRWPDAPRDAGHAGASASVISAVDRIERFVAHRLFRLIFRKARRTSERPVPLGDRLPDADVVRLSDAPDALFRATKGLDLDVVVDLRMSGTPDGLRCPARLGVWSLDIGQRLDAAQRFLPVGIREVCVGDPTVHVALRSELDGGDAKTLLTGSYRNFLWSWNENARQLRFKAGVIIIDALRAAARGELPVARSGEVQSGSAPMTATQLIWGLLKCWWRIGSETLGRVLREEKWRLYVAPLEEGAGTPVGSDLGKALCMEAPRDSYWADPFPIERDGRQCVFFEEFPYATRKGIISVADYEVRGDDVVVGPAQTVIEQATHMSYPFLFEMGDDLYMIPETSAEHTIGLWKCTAFPGSWHKVRNLMEGVSATDTTLVHHKGRWWMFTNIDRSGLGDHCSELHVFHSDDPLAGEWTAHAMNPVVRDSRSARMAGPLTWSRHDGLIRPAQVNDHYYGHAVSLQRVTRLDPDVYEEECVRRIDADWQPGIYRNHHIAPIGDSVVIDACRNQFKFPRLWNAWKKMIPFADRRLATSSKRGADTLTTTA